MNQNLKAFLDMIAVSEGTSTCKATQDRGYDIVVGGTHFDDYSDHPRKRVWIEKIKDYSTAAGRYQVMQRYYDAYRKSLGLPDFSPESQDKIAIQLIKECHALDLIEQGEIETAIYRCRSRWASFPGAGYNQHENKLQPLIAAYIKAGGKLSKSFDDYV